MSGEREHINNYGSCFERDLELAKLYEENKNEDPSKEFCRPNKNYMFRLFLEDGEHRRNCLQKYQGVYWFNTLGKGRNAFPQITKSKKRRTVEHTCICDHTIDLASIKMSNSCICFSKKNEELNMLGYNMNGKKCMYPQVLRLSNFKIMRNKRNHSMINNNYKVSINKLHVHLPIEDKITELLKHNQDNLRNSGSIIIATSSHINSSNNNEKNIVETKQKNESKRELYLHKTNGLYRKGTIQKESKGKVRDLTNRIAEQAENETSELPYKIPNSTFSPMMQKLIHTSGVNHNTPSALVIPAYASGIYNLLESQYTLAFAVIIFFIVSIAALRCIFKERSDIDTLSYSIDSPRRISFISYDSDGSEDY